MNQQEIQNLSETFKKRRKELNISLKEVENATSIRMSYLEAIEAGEVNKLISPVYAHGFVKQYAIYLGLDGDAIIRQNPHIFSRQETQEFAYGIGTLEMRGHPGAGVKWFPNAIWIGAFLLILCAAWYFAKFLEVI